MHVCIGILVYLYSAMFIRTHNHTHNNSLCLHIYIYKRRRRIYCNCSALYLFWPFQGHSCLQKNYTDDLGVKKIDSVTDILNSYVHSASFSPMTSVPGHFRWKFTDSEATLSPRGRRNCRSPPVGQVHFCGWNLPQSWQPLAAQHYDPLVRHSGCNEQLYRRAIAISAPGHYQLKRRQ